MSDTLFTVDLNETFPKLAKAPVVEAVIHWQARAQVEFELSTLEAALENEFPEYVARKPLHAVDLTAQWSGKSEDENFVKKINRWEGIRLKSNDGRYVIRFTRNGLAFSRTHGYEDWESFSTAAKEAWSVYQRIAQPADVERLGVRFINHIADAMPGNIADFLRDPPTHARNLQLKEFVYQSTFALPESPFDARIIKVMQQSPETKESGLFIDIDVFSTTTNSIDGVELEDSLRKIRWFKNKLFFTLVTDHAVKLFGG